MSSLKEIFLLFTDSGTFFLFLTKSELINIRVNLGCVETYDRDTKMIKEVFDLFYLHLMHIMRITLSGIMALLLTVKTGNVHCEITVKIVYNMTAIVI